jgi:hypothetical protein
LRILINRQKKSISESSYKLAGCIFQSTSTIA